MTKPSPGYTVHTKELHDEAAVWDHQSRELKAVASKAESLRMNRIEAGVFQLLVTSYGPLIEQVVALCNEGHQRTAEIANALRDAAGRYQRAEEEGEARIKALF